MIKEMAKKINDLVDFWTVDQNLAKKVQEHFKIIGDEEFLGERDYVYALIGIPRSETISFLAVQEKILPLASYYLIINDRRKRANYFQIRTHWKGTFKTITDENEIKEYLSNEENWYCIGVN